MDGIIIWTWFEDGKLSINNEYRALFEDKLNPNSAPYAHLGHPMYPNEAGIRFIDLKNEWTSNIEFEFDGNRQKSLRLFHADYSVTVEMDNNMLFNETYSVSKSSACDLSAISRMKFEFDKNYHNVILHGSSGRIWYDGYLLNSLRVSDRNPDDNYLKIELDTIPDGDYIVIFLLKFITETKIDNNQNVVVSTANGEMDRIQVTKSESDWFKFEKNVHLDESDEFIVINVNNDNANDFLIDHFLIIAEEDFNQCNQKISIDLSPTGPTTTTMPPASSTTNSKYYIITQKMNKKYEIDM